MKDIVCCTILLLICVLTTQVQGDCVFGNETLAVGEHYRNCSRVKCEDNGTTFAVGCGTWQCAEGTQIGYRELDLSKPYPDCCAGPICKAD